MNTTITTTVSKIPPAESSLFLTIAMCFCLATTWSLVDSLRNPLDAKTSAESVSR